jgi:hypothetical protein
VPSLETIDRFRWGPVRAERLANLIERDFRLPDVSCS